MAMKKPRARLWCVVMAAFLQIWKNSQSPRKKHAHKKRKEKAKEKRLSNSKNKKHILTVFSFFSFSFSIPFFNCFLVDVTKCNCLFEFWGTQKRVMGQWFLFGSIHFASNHRHWLACAHSMPLVCFHTCPKHAFSSDHSHSLNNVWFWFVSGVTTVPPHPLCFHHCAPHVSNHHQSLLTLALSFTQE